MDWILWHVVEKSSALSILVMMCVGASVAAQYCEHHFIRYAKQSPLVPDWWKSLVFDDQQSLFYQGFVALSVGVWMLAVLLVSIGEWNAKSTLGIAFSFFTGSTVGLAKYFKQQTTP